MSPPEFLIACVGKPSAGKSSFLNAITNARAKVGAYPFTTIQPNDGVAFYSMQCPCHQASNRCRPRYGSCTAHTRRRFIPLRILDIAGLIPGAHQGLGLGNQFLNDIRAAHLLLHILDASGSTDQQGREAAGYDPSADVEWLLDEIRLWIYGNVRDLWTSSVRRKWGSALQLSNQDWVEILLKLFSGYGVNKAFCTRFLSSIPQELYQKPLNDWSVDEELNKFVQIFVKERFPMILVLNKIDLADADRNIQKILKKFPEMENRMVFTSALAELFLRKLHSSHFIHYVEGTDQIYTATDPPPPDMNIAPLQPMDEKTLARLEKVQDLVLFRYGSTGCQAVIQMAVHALRLIPVFPVRSVHNNQALTQLYPASTSTSGGSIGAAAHDGSNSTATFCDCYLIPSGTTVGELCRMLFSASVMEKNCVQVESQQGRVMSEDDRLEWNEHLAEHGLVLGFKFRGMADG